jgi:hypothetical protein
LLKTKIKAAGSLARMLRSLVLYPRVISGQFPECGRFQPFEIAFAGLGLRQ